MKKRPHADRPAMQPIGVDNLDTGSLTENPHNPRHLFDRVDLSVLKDSIERVGILVPLTVFRRASDGKHIILDGQRRWICATELGLPQVPVNIVREPTPVQNIVTMFQIHKLRLDWELMPTALKLEHLMNLVNDKNSKRIASLTGLDEANVNRCKKLLSFDRSYQNLMLDADPTKRVKADFFIELHAVLHDRFVKSLSWFKAAYFIDQMLKKHSRRVLRSVTEFRIVKQCIGNAVRAGRGAEVGRRLHDFVRQLDATVEHLAIAEAGVTASAKQMAGACAKLSSRLTELDVDRFAGERGLWKAIHILWKVAGEKLTASEYRDDE